MKYLHIEPRDPLIARDGRPFVLGGGNRMRPLDWLLPSVVAGSLRTLLGKCENPAFPPDLVQKLKDTAVHGPLLQHGGQLYFSAPKDAVFREDWCEVERARPSELGPGENTDIPIKELWPVTLPEALKDDFKPTKAPAFWSLKRMQEWLLDEELTVPVPKKEMELGYLKSLPPDERWHVSIEAATNAAKDEHLFLTCGLTFPEGYNLAARFGGPTEWKFEPQWHPLGGDRRLAHWGHGGGEEWKCPSDIAKAVRKGSRLRMILATPALFRAGWLPGWAEEGKLPGTDVAVRLVGVCGDRWKAVSGYSLERGKRGFKPVRRLVPAGNVYFFERLGEKELDIEKLWLKPVSEKVSEFHDGPKDGFGLALWGVW